MNGLRTAKTGILSTVSEDDSDDKTQTFVFRDRRLDRIALPDHFQNRSRRHGRGLHGKEYVSTYDAYRQ
jgi:hypothetical protein